MAVTVITPLSLVLDTASIDHADANATAIATGADGWECDIGKARKVVIKFVTDATGSTETITAGDLPPSHRKGLGNLAITMAASDVKYVVIDAARFKHNDGLIRGTCSLDADKITVFKLPDTL